MQKQKYGKYKQGSVAITSPVPGKECAGARRTNLPDADVAAQPFALVALFRPHRRTRVRAESVYIARRVRLT